MKARALWHIGPDQSALREQVLGELPAGHVRVRALASGISRGTESLVRSGRVPPSVRAQMAAPFQEGEFSFPLKYGYCSVGQVVAGSVPGLALGSRVFCLHPHQDLYQVPATSLTLLPEGVPTHRAVLSANLETALNAVWDASPGPGDRITVVGAGVLGSLCAWICAGIIGCHVTLVDTLPQRAALAEELGVAFSSPDAAQGEQDLVIHASASQEGLALSLSLAGVEATVLELSWYGSRSPSVPLGLSFHSKRLTLRSSQVGQLPPSRRPRWDAARRLGVVMELLAAPALDALLEPPVRFSELARSFGPICQRPGLMCQVIDYEEEG